jgi:cell division protease FtsH
VAEVSPHTHQLVDDEVHRIVEGSYGEVLSVLRQNRPRLDSVAAALLEHETLDEAEAYAASGVDRPNGASGAYAVAARTVSS